MYSPDFVRKLGAQIQSEWKDFESKHFSETVLDDSW